MSQETDDLRKRLVDLYTTPEEAPKSNVPVHVAGRKTPPHLTRSKYRAGYAAQMKLRKLADML